MFDDTTQNLDVDDTVSIAGSAEAVLRSALTAVETSLANLRANREALAADIRQLVADQEILRAAIRPFDRAASAVPSPNGDE